MVSHHSATTLSVARVTGTPTLVDSADGLTFIPGVVITLVATSVPLRGAHDDDGALGMVDTLLTDGAEQ